MKDMKDMNEKNQTNLVDRYLNAVAERLPEDTREDVKKELRANIEDMLPDAPAEEDIRNVLGKLGNPAKLANEYRQTKRYLIGPNLYDSYISTLKLVIGIAVIVAAFFGILEHITNLPAGNSAVSSDFIADTIASIIASSFSGAAQAFVWVTLVFSALDKAGLGEGKFSFSKKEWSVDDLPEVTTSSKGKISSAETIVEMVFTILFTTLLILQPQLFGWYEKGDSGLMQITPLFNIDRLQSYVPVIILLFAIQFVMSIYKFIIKRWNLALAITNTIYNIVASIFTFVILLDRSVFNQGFISNIAEAVKKPVADVNIGFYAFLVVFIIVSILFYAIDSISGFVKSRRITLHSVKIK